MWGNPGYKTSVPVARLWYARRPCVCRPRKFFRDSADKTLGLFFELKLCKADFIFHRRGPRPLGWEARPQRRNERKTGESERERKVKYYKVKSSQEANSPRYRAFSSIFQFPKKIPYHGTEGGLNPGGASVLALKTGKWASGGTGGGGGKRPPLSPCCIRAPAFLLVSLSCP